jgi:WD40 repeat protein
MPSQAGSEAGHRWLVVAGTAHYENPATRELAQVPSELDRIRTSFAAAGYERLASVTDPDRDQLRGLFAKAKKEGAEGNLVVAYYTGHGAKGADRFYLLTRESDYDDLSETALAVEDLARALTEGSKASQVLVILDTCYAGAGAADFAQIASRLTIAHGGAGPGVFVIAAARTKQEADQGALSTALEQALANHDERLGGRTQAFLAMDEVMGAVQEFLRERYPKQVATWSSVNVQGRCRLFPNPRHQPEVRPGLDLETQRAFTEHWVPKARGAELGAGGWYFTGRERVLRELAKWLQEADSGGQPRVVTGGAGSGKSAVLARIVTLADPKYRTDVLASSGSAALDPSTLPPEGVVNVAVHARRKLLGDVVAQIAGGLNLTAREPADLIDALAHRQEKTVIVVDALDEADDREQIVSQLLRGLVGLPHVFLLLGTRPDSSEHLGRFRALGESVVEMDLDDPHYIGADDIAQYVERRLLAAEEPTRITPYRGALGVAHTVAQALSERANNIFLVAHTAVLALLANPSVFDVTVPGWIERLPTGFDEAFAQFLAEVDARRPGGLSSAMVRAVLLPLAFAEGEGLPWVDFWATVAIRISGMSVSDVDIALVRQHAGAFIIEANESDRSVYRLYHERIAEYLRHTVDVAQAQGHIVKALRARVPISFAAQGPDWPRAHPYILAHLASHALQAGMISDLVDDGMFVAAAEPLRTLQVLAKSIDSFARRAYGSYALAFRNLCDRPPEDRLSYLEMASRQLGDDLIADLWIRRLPARAWGVPWMCWSIVSPHRVIPASGGILSSALGTLDERLVIVSGGWDGTVRVWDLASGAPHVEPLRGHDVQVNSVALGTLGGRSVIVSGGWDGTLRVWDLASGATHGAPLRGHEGEVSSVALGTLDGQSVIVSGGRDDATVRLWDLTLGASLGSPLRPHEGGVWTVAFGTLDGHSVIVSGGMDGTVRVWDLASGAPHGAPLRGHEGEVRSVVLGTLEGQPVIVSGGTDGTVRVWDLASGVPHGRPLRGHIGGVNTVALGDLDGRPVIVSGGWDRTLRVWDLASGAQHGEPLRGHEGGVRSAVLGTLEGRPVIVSGGNDYTIRVWNPMSVVPRGTPLPGHEGGVWTVALGMLDGRPVIVSGGRDATVRVWDLASGAPRGGPLRAHEGGVYSVALGTLYGRSVIVSSGVDGTVRVWDLASGASVGAPLHGHVGGVWTIALGSLDGRSVIVSGGLDQTLRVWDLASGASRGEPLRAHEGRASALAIGTINGRPVIVTGGIDGIVRIRDLALGTPHGKPLRGHVGRVFSIALGTLEGRSVIVSGGSDATVRLWDLASGAPRGQPLRGHEGGVRSVRLGTLNGRSVIVSGGVDGTVQVWDAGGGKISIVHVGVTIFTLAIGDSGSVVIAGLSGLMAVQFLLNDDCGRAH